MPCMIDTEKEVSSKLYAKPRVGNVFFPVCQVVKFNVKIYVCVPMSLLRFHHRFPYFSPKIRMFSKKKGLHFDFISDFPIFLPKSGCSLKKKKGLHLISSRRRVRYKITSRAMIGTRAGGCRPLC